MLNGATKNPDAKNLHVWHDILRVNEKKQVMFIARVMLLHEVSMKRGGRAAMHRLTLADWMLECDRMCLITHIFEMMEKEVSDETGLRVFDDDLLESLAKRSIEGTLGGNQTTVISFRCDVTQNG